MPNPRNGWTRRFYGVAHLGKVGDARRASVCPLPSGKTMLDCYTRTADGRTIIAHGEVQFPTEKQARTAGEAWVHNQTEPR